MKFNENYNVQKEAKRRQNEVSAFYKIQILELSFVVCSLLFEYVNIAFVWCETNK